jgi:hypothetical protein
LRIYTVIVIFLVTASTSLAQLKYSDHLAGGSIGFSNKTTTPILGANWEYQLPQAGLGMFAVGFLGRYWGATDRFATGDVQSSVVALGLQINYNFNLIGSGKFVPFVGMVFGYRNATTKYKAYNNTSVIAYDQQFKTGFLLWAQTGFRYLLSRQVAGSVRLGLGNLDFSTVEIGLDYIF